MLRFISSVVKLVRPLNFIISFLSIMVAGIICDNPMFRFNAVVIASFAGALTGAAGNIINDYFDYEIDKINKPKRVLPAGELSNRQVLFIYFGFLFLIAILSYNLNTAGIIIVIFANIMIYLYSFKLKKIPLVGNFVVSFFTGTAFIFGGAVVYNFYGAVIPAIFAFVINFIREIVKDVEDIKGDSAVGVFTYPFVAGYDKTYKLIFGLTITLILLTQIPFIFHFYKIDYYLLVMVFVNPLLVYVLKVLWGNNNIKEVKKAGGLLKLVMLFGLLAIYAGN